MVQAHVYNFPANSLRATRKHFQVKNILAKLIPLTKNHTQKGV